MKKIIQVVSFAFIALVFSAVAANAQSVQKYKAEIPFAFSLGNHNYEPGTYSVKVAKLDSSSGVLTLIDNQGKALQRVMVSQTVGTSRDSVFEFIRTGSERSLSRIATPDSGFQLHRSSRKSKTVAENTAKVPAAGYED
jgi:hypothetical protein